MEKEKLLAPLQGQLAVKDEQIKALTEAITALSKTDAPAASINAALEELKQGNTAKAQTIFAEEAAGKMNNREAAEAYRHLGAFGFMSSTKAALAAYQKAVALGPDNKLGLFLERGWEFDKAEQAYRKVLALSESRQDKMLMVWVYGRENAQESFRYLMCDFFESICGAIKPSTSSGGRLRAKSRKTQTACAKISRIRPR